MKHVVAIDIGGTAIKIALLDMQGTILSFREQLTNAQFGVDILLDTLCDIISEFGEVDCVGVSTAGQVDAAEGKIVFATESIPGYTGTMLRQFLQEKLGVSVAVENDANCAAIGEANYGAGRGIENFICITYGTGIGGAIVQNCKVYSGARGLSGGFGHMITHAGGAQCVCGGRGCYEMCSSTNALLHRVESTTGKLMTGKDVFANFDDPQIKAEIDGWLDEIVYGLVSLTHIFNPYTFILGGGIMNEPYVISSISSRLSKNVMPSYNPITVKRAQLGNKAGIMGAFYNAVKKE